MLLIRFLSAALALCLSSEARKPHDAILLTGVKSLTLRSGKQTAHRRVSSIPQLRCIGGNAKGYHEVDAMRCTNMGSDYDQNDVQWTCQANLPAEFKLGSTEVMCEGYSSPEDPYILKGSCGVEYRLVLTELGEQRYGSDRPMPRFDTVVSTLVILFIFGVFAYIIWVTCISNQGRGHDREPRGGGWDGGPGGGPGGGGPFGGDDDPPPPYTPSPSGAKAYSQANPSSSSAGQQQQGRNNFWTNTLGGAAAGFLAGRMTAGNRQQGNRFGAYDRLGQRGGWGNGGNDYDSGWGSRPDYGRSSGSSGNTHQSTGFGGTTRR